VFDITLLSQSSEGFKITLIRDPCNIFKVPYYNIILKFLVSNMKSMFDLCKTQMSGKSKSNEEIELEKKLTALGYFQGATGGHLEFAVCHF